MLNVTLFMYQLFGALFTSFVPLVLTLSLIWMLILFGKKMYRSIIK